MPQLDKLTFIAQIFWFLILFVIFYYVFVQVVILRLKFSLGLKRFFFSNEKFLFLNDFFSIFGHKKNHLQSLSLFFNEEENFNISNNFFNFYFNILLVNLNKFVGSTSLSLKSFIKNKYLYLLNINFNYYYYYFFNLVKKKNLNLSFLSFVSRKISSVYSFVNGLFNFFFSVLIFSLYEVNLILLFNFLEMINNFANFLVLLKLLSKI